MTAGELPHGSSVSFRLNFYNSENLGILNRPLLGIGFMLKFTPDEMESCDDCLLGSDHQTINQFARSVTMKITPTHAQSGQMKIFLPCFVHNSLDCILWVPFRFGVRYIPYFRRVHGHNFLISTLQWVIFNLMLAGWRSRSPSTHSGQAGYFCFHPSLPVSRSLAQMIAI